MVKLYYPSPDEVQGARPLMELLWFVEYQSLLVALANTHEGRDLLCIDSWAKMPYPVVRLDKNMVRFYLGRWDGCDHWISDFRVGAKWGNVIRYRWQAVRQALDRMNLRALLALPQLLVLDDGRRLLIPAGGATTTFYPDAHVESTSVDGYILRLATEAFADLRSGNGTHPSDSGTSILDQVETETTTFRRIYRGAFLFLTSAIGSGGTISSATFQFTASAADDGFAENASSSMVVSAPDSNTAIIASDYENGFTSDIKQATDLLMSGITADSSTYNVFTLNATGEGNISKTSVSKFGVRSTFDVDNSAPTHAANVKAGLAIRSADETGTNIDPKLVVVHASAYGPFTATLAVGCVESASRQADFPRTASLAVGCVEAASRATGYTRAATTLASGMVVTADRTMGYTRAASVLAVGLAVSASKSMGYIRTASRAVGLVVAATRSLTFARAAASLAVGMLPFSTIREQIKRLRRAVGTNRTTSQVGTNRTNSQVGTNRDMETF